MPTVDKKSLLKKKKKKRERASANHNPASRSSFRPEFNGEVERLCGLGVTDTDICLFFDVSVTTLNKWKERHPEFFVALLRGKQEADNAVAAALYNNAVGYDYCEDSAVKVKSEVRDERGRIVETREIVEVVQLKKHAKADTTAQIFYLSNRRPDIWRRNAQNNPEVEVKDENVYVGEEALAAMKREGFVLLEGEYELVGGGDADQSNSKTNAEEASP